MAKVVAFYVREKGEKPRKHYPQYNKKSQWGNDRVIMYRDQVMHDRLVHDYRSQIGQDDRHTEEGLERLEPFFGVIVLRNDVSEEAPGAKELYLKYKKTLEHRNTLQLCGKCSEI